MIEAMPLSRLARSKVMLREPASTTGSSVVLLSTPLQIANAPLEGNVCDCEMLLRPAPLLFDEIR